LSSYDSKGKKKEKRKREKRFLGTGFSEPAQFFGFRTYRLKPEKSGQNILCGGKRVLLGKIRIDAAGQYLYAPATSLERQSHLSISLGCFTGLWPLDSPRIPIQRRSGGSGASRWLVCREPCNEIFLWAFIIHVCMHIHMHRERKR